jgi:hypothetical protein
MKLRLYPDEEIDEDNSKIYEEDDMVLCKMPDGTIRSCGFSVNSLLMREGKSPMMTVNSLDKDSRNLNTRDNKNVSDLFKHFAVPAGIFYTQPKGIISKKQCVNEEDLDDEIYDRLIALASINAARKNKKSKKRTTRGTSHGTKKSRG